MVILLVYVWFTQYVNMGIFSLIFSWNSSQGNTPTWICLDRYNQIPHTGWLNNRSLFSYSSGGWEIKDQGTGKFGFWWGIPAWLADSHQMRAPPFWRHLTFITSLEAPSANTATVGVGLQPVNFGRIHSVHNILPLALQIHVLLTCKIYILHPNSHPSL